MPFSFSVVLSWSEEMFNFEFFAGDCGDWGKTDIELPDEGLGICGWGWLTALAKPGTGIGG